MNVFSNRWDILIKIQKVFSNIISNLKMVLLIGQKITNNEHRDNQLILMKK
jgi:hypothetical protein